ncbi:sialidase family protein [Parapedobacter indicus]|uniref:BNR repeat-like domain-containing protein n=1 Tax=Parapedobacter indicus TaxID=1477437 RepID=A0A1I3F1R0_9SPHI|nr:sialidase family protein [Parapedobacter indicus]PPL03520.1 hypothetical protein CLV26_102124 [Parapedobacter indicus]SFI05127.1 hypothetical protein SAMN05444682_102124 [Parapedobacter indicus]
MNRNPWIFVVVLAGALGACSSQPPPNEESPKTLAITQGHSATAPYFTCDNEGNPVLCWTEKIDTDGTYQLAFAKYDTASGDFGTPITVTGSEGISTSPESMGKIAFKDDGTIVAVFAKPFLREKSPFAGAIYYSISSDQGVSWSPPDFLHSDTAHHYGRNFFDIARLNNGEIGAVWLDGRDKSIEGSTLYFATTAPDSGFVSETALHRGTCECCRTDLLVDRDGSIHVAYRSLMYPSALFGEQARDMAYIHSEDNGRTFSPEATISADNWAIRACPHTGPTLASENGRIHTVWFTAGGTPGLYYTHNASGGNRFNERQLLTTTGSHPQSLALGTDTVLVAYEDRPMPPATHSTGHGGTHRDLHGHDHHENAPDIGMRSHILIHPIINGYPAAPIAISSNDAYNHHPVMTKVNEGGLIAWVCEENNSTAIVYKQVKLGEIK